MYRMTTMTTIALTMIAGTALPVSATLASGPKDQTRSQTQHTQSHHERKAMKAKKAHAEPIRTGFHRSSDLLGMDVLNSDGDPVGSVEDMVVDRGTGAIEYVILSSGGFFGLGDDQVAVRYGAFGFDRAEGVYRLDVTQDEVKNSAEFKPENWVGLEYETWTEQLESMYNETRRAIDDMFADESGDAEGVEIDGTVTRINRDLGIVGDEHVEVVIENSEGEEHVVVLGPSWYVMGDRAAPMRGDEISITGYRSGESGNGRIVAQDAIIDGESMTLRDDKRVPAWSHDSSKDDQYNYGRSDKTNKNSKGGSMAQAAPMMLLSDLVGMDAGARDERGGEIADTVIEVASGRIAMLVFDPTEAFLGMGDTLRVVPWSIAAVGPGSVTLDADEQMLTRGEELPDDVSVYGNSSRLNAVYRAFGADVAEFKARERDGWTSSETYRGWSNGEKLADAVIDGDAVEIHGTVRGMTSTTPVKDGTKASAVRVQTKKGTETIVLGPEAFIESQNLDLGYGDEVTIEAKRAMVDGREVIVGCELTANGRTITLWDNDNPMWGEG